MDAFELLKKDHKKVSQLFSEIESASGQTKKQLFSKLKSELDLHAHIEESFLYPALENKEVSREITLEAYEEHKVVKDLLADLGNGNAPEDEWDAKLKVLKENVEHHVEEEESELFDKAQDALSDDQIEQLGADMELEKVRNNGGDPNAQATKTPRPKKQPAREEKSTPGGLKRLANLVGLGDSPSEGGAKKATKKASPSKATKKAAPSKSTASRKAKSSKSATKTSGKSGGAAKASTVSKKKSSGGRSSKKTTKRSVSTKSSKGRGTKTGGRRR